MHIDIVLCWRMRLNGSRMRTSPQIMPDHELNASMVNRIRVAKQLVRPATALV